MSSIEVWLDSHPHDPSDYESGQQRPHKRQCLAEVSGNMSHQPRRSPRKAPPPPPPPPPPAPPKTPPRGFSAQQASPSRVDEQTTPRPPWTAAIPVLEPSSAVASRRSPSPSQSLSYASSNRSRSPVRRMGDLQLSDLQIQFTAIGRQGRVVPEDVRELCRDIRRVGTGKGVIPRTVITDAAILLDECMLDEANFTETAGDGADALEHKRFWTRVQELLDAAFECQEAGLYEAAWNSEVHSRILRLALQGEREAARVWYRDITTARITDASLLPTSAAGLVLQSKMVDYALILDSSADAHLHTQIVAKLRHEGAPSINHTTAEHTRFSPIAVSIETKRGAVEEDAANLQLTIWVSAHFRRLQQLIVGSSSTVPSLPLVIVQGHEWKMMLAECTTNGGIRIYRDLKLGATDSVLGIYQLVVSLRTLAGWIEKKYRPWFEQEALGIR